MYVALKWPNNNGTRDLQQSFVYSYSGIRPIERTHNNVQSSLLTVTPIRRTPLQIKTDTQSWSQPFFTAFISVTF